MKTIPTEVFNQLYKDQYRKLCSYAFRLLKDEELSSDVVQECFARLLKQDYERFQDRLNSWLFTVCRNLSFKQIQKRKRFVEIFEEDRDELDENRDPSEEMDMNHYKKVLMNCIENLSPRQKEVIKLRFFGDYDYNECAKILNTSSGNVGFNQSTAIQNLRKMMAEYI
jgi:RNA polymerase sigma factor (sigma-70 family)